MMNVVKGKKKLINVKTVSCPECSYKLPVFRIPKSLSQFMWGGWSCPNCGCKIGRYGEPYDHAK